LLRDSITCLRCGYGRSSKNGQLTEFCSQHQDSNEMLLGLYREKHSDIYRKKLISQRNHLRDLLRAPTLTDFSDEFSCDNVDGSMSLNMVDVTFKYVKSISSDDIDF